MPDFHSVNLADLSASFSTRRRGEEAYERLLPQLGQGPLVIDLDSAELLSASFLDGLLLKLIQGGHADDTWFKTNDDRAKSRLQRLSGLRKVDIYTYGQPAGVSKLEPRQPQRLKTQFTKEKPKSTLRS